MADTQMKTNAKFEKGEDNKGTLTFEIPAATVEETVDHVFDHHKKDISIPGFRKGKVTKELYMQRFGEESLYQDALNHILPEAFEAATLEADVTTVGRPEIEVTSMESGKPWMISAKVELAPEIKLGDYKGVEVEKPETDVKNEEVDAEIDRMREGQAELVVAKDGAKAEKGDTVVIDFDGDVDGDHFDGGKAENFSLSLGSGQFIDGFEDQLIGKTAGEDVDVNVTFPAEYQAENLAGKAAHFAVKLHEIKQRQLPELDDEFAKDVDDSVETLADLKKKIQGRLIEQKKSQAEDATEAAVVNKVVENAEVEGGKIPQAMIDEDVSRQMQQFASQMAQQGISPDMYYRMTGSNDEQMRAQFSEGADERVKTNLVLEEIVRAEKIEPTDDDIQKEIDSLAEQYNMEAKQVRASLSDNLLRHDIAIRQAVDMMVKSAKLK